MSIAESFFRTFATLRGLQLQQEQIAVAQENARTGFMQSMMTTISALPVDARESAIRQYEQATGIPLPHIHEIAKAMPESESVQRNRYIQEAVASGILTPEQATAWAIGASGGSSGIVTDRLRARAVVQGNENLSGEEQATLSRAAAEREVYGTRRSAELMEGGAVDALSDKAIRDQVVAVTQGRQLNAAQKLQQMLTETQQKISQYQFNQDLALRAKSLNLQTGLGLLQLDNSAANNVMNAGVALSRGGAGPGGAGAAVGMTPEEYKVQTIDDFVDNLKKRTDTKTAFQRSAGLWKSSEEKAIIGAIDQANLSSFELTRRKMANPQQFMPQPRQQGRLTFGGQPLGSGGSINSPLNVPSPGMFFDAMAGRIGYDPRGNR